MKYDWKGSWSVISGEFYGEIRGNNHTISNLANAALFEHFSGKVDRLNMKDYAYGVNWKDGFINWSSSNPMRSKIAAFALKATNATFTNMKFTNMTMLGNTGVATMVVEDENCTYENIHIEKAYVNGRSYGSKLSAMVAVKTGGSIKNCYVQGEIYGSGKRAAGIVALSQGDVTIENVIANVYMSCSESQMYPDNTETWGGFVGEVGTGNLTVKNSAMINKLQQNNNPINKFIATVVDGANATFENCYENEDANGTASDTIDGINVVTNAELLTKEFYTSRLLLDESIWNLDNIAQADITSADNKVVRFITFGLQEF